MSDELQEELNLLCQQEAELTATKEKVTHDLIMLNMRIQDIERQLLLAKCRKEPVRKMMLLLHSPTQEQLDMVKNSGNELKRYWYPLETEGHDVPACCLHLSNNVNLIVKSFNTVGKIVGLKPPTNEIEEYIYPILVKRIENLFPVELILEAPDMFSTWFYDLFAPTREISINFSKDYNHVFLNVYVEMEKEKKC